MLSILSGEEFVSLWELKASIGLSIFSTFYDEVIPFAKNFNKANKKLGYFLLKSCKYLFTAFHEECMSINGYHVMNFYD